MRSGSYSSTVITSYSIHYTKLYEVWLLAEQDQQGLWHFAADSEARIVRGLLAVVLAALNHKSAEQILAVDSSRIYRR